VSGRISYWLIPAEPEKSIFERIICDLAQRFDAPVFEPHLTLYSGPGDERDNLDEIIARSTAGISEVVLRTSGVAHSNQFTKCLFVNFELNETVAKIANDLKEHFADQDGYELKPHLSLLYAQIRDDVKERLARELSIPRAVRFDTVRAVSTGIGMVRKAEVEEWRVLVTRQLHSA